MSDRFEFEGRTAIVTGAASGIGAALAEGLAGRGCNLILTDIEANGLALVAERVRRPGMTAETHAFDVGDAQAVKAFARTVAAKHDEVHLLFNNAGVAVGGTFERTSEADFDWLMGINFQGVVRMTRAFLPLMKRSGEAQIVNISSIFGIIAPAGQTAYSSAKFAVRGFSSALRHELHGTPIGVTTVHPGGIATNIADRARMPADASEAEIADGKDRARRSLVMPPPEAAEIILRGVERRRARILVGRDAHTLAILERLFPVTYWGAVQRFLAPKTD
jgi:short-subunit dehydrogenase